MPGAADAGAGKEPSGAGGTVETVWHPAGDEIRSSGEIDAVREFLSVYGE
ncbi:hypothetical protein C241_24910 [Bradyrhizobium lupini HPC(L)]|uniref:Uncharacterized protein n=1 Tax=Bradyrhizobium lupini HPC(L) TaxID=1229491 RepID=A0ABN0HFP7_RHILU|nr:hypothetical protein C241_24910 [Bradyrhizobium lupini HPC(L)]